MIQQARAVREWFDIVASAFGAISKEELDINDLRNYFAASGEPPDGAPYDPGNRSQYVSLTDTLGKLAHSFGKHGLLIIRHDLDRFTPNLGLHVPEDVFRLSPRGKRLISRPAWRRTAFFLRTQILSTMLKLLERFRVTLAIVGAVFMVLKFALQLDSYAALTAAVVAAIVGVVATVFH